MAGSAACALLLSAAVGAQPAAFSFPLQQVWSVTLAAPPVSPPAYDDVHAYVPLRGSRLAAVDLEDGHVAWTVDTVPDAALAAGDGLVFIASRDLLEARSALDGAARWRVPLEGGPSGPLCWNAGWLIAGTDRNEILAFRAADGQVLWRRLFGSSLRTAPALSGSRLYAALADGHVVALTLQTGELSWTSGLGSPATGLLPLDDRLFVGSIDNHVYSLSAGNGSVRWRWRTGGDIVGSPVVDRESVYFVSLDNEIRALSPSNGRLKWQRPLPIRPSTGPQLIGETIVVAGVATELRAYRSRDGSPAGEFAVRSAEGEELQLAAPPHLIGAPSTALIILTRNGVMQRVGPAAPAP